MLPTIIIRLASVLTIFLASCINAQEAISTPFTTVPIPNWVKPLQIPISTKAQEEQTQDGVYYLLVDRQIKADADQPLVLYRHFAEKVINNGGLKSVSNINITYDPIYESLKWHHLNIIRDGKVIDRKSEVKVTTLHREKELENSIYNGRLTANIIIADLRIGDIVDYSYMIVGHNPIYGDHFADVEYLEWSVPIGKLHFYLDWGKPIKLQYKAVQTDVALKIFTKNNRTQYEYDLDNTLPIKTNLQTPSWYDPYGRYYFSDIDNWQDVISWAIPLYESAIKTSPSIKEIAAGIISEGGSQSRLAALALHYVQDNIRYLGVEMGKNSHQPSEATVTLNRRYGDCKDKAVLLITLLQELGIAAEPALVNTETRKEIINQIPSINAFDHVIVHVEINGSTYWIDPTREHQKGDLEVIFSDSYGYGLIVNKSFTNLTEMKVSRNSMEKIVENFDISGELVAPVIYTVNSQFTGYESEISRSGFFNSNASQKTDQYLNFYKGFYDHVRINKNINFEDNDISGMFKTTEEYIIQPFWETDKNKKSTASFYASGISSVLNKPDELVRVAPFYVRHREIKEIISIKLDDAGWDFKNSRFEEKNKFFTFNRVVMFDKEKLVLNLEYYYKTLSDFIDAKDISAYMDARKKVMDQVEYAIYQNGGIESSLTDSSEAKFSFFSKIFLNQIFWLGVAAFLYLAAVIVLFSNWYTDKLRLHYFADTKFYPVAPLKFVILSLVTFGVYIIYWFYHNWSYISRKDSANIFPFWRSFFYSLWFYPFYQRLVNGQESDSVSFLPKAKWFSIPLAILVFLLVLATSLDYFGFFFQLIFVVICLALVIQITKIPQENDLGFKSNSRWLLRHYLLVAVSLPIFLLVVGQDIGMLPNTDVVAGNRLYANHIRFLKRHKVIPSHSKVLYFYSSASLDLYDAGNGFTDKTIFSYWHDEDGKLEVRSIPFSNVEKIIDNKSDGFADNKTLSIIDNQGEELDLYLGSSDSKNKSFIKSIFTQWRREVAKPKL